MIKQFISRCFISIPKYQPKPIRMVDIELPKRPKLDPNDPNEKWEIPKVPEFAFKTEQTNRRTYPGTNYVAVHKNGRTYHLFDASRIPYGKMCVRIAKYLCGKHSPLYKNNQNGISDVCVIVNASDMLFTGKKINQKYLTYHTGYVGNLKDISYRHMVLNKPEQLIAYTVNKMLPKNKLRPDKLDDLHVFRGRFHTFDKILPQILPHQVEFEYNGSLQEDIKSQNDITVKFSNKPLEETQKLLADEYPNLKYDLQEEDSFNSPEFLPFSQRGTKIKRAISQRAWDKLVRRRKHVMKRYRIYRVQPYTDPKSKYKTEGRVNLVTSKLQLKRLGLEKEAPQDDDPEVEDDEQ